MRHSYEDEPFFPRRVPWFSGRNGERIPKRARRFKEESRHRTGRDAPDLEMTSTSHSLIFTGVPSGRYLYNSRMSGFAIAIQPAVQLYHSFICPGSRSPG
jgi:hypothetical protein